MEHSQDVQDQVGNFVGKLEAEAKRRVDRRRPVEQRWMEDLRQYHGQYSEDTTRRLKGNKKSMVFLNLTRSKTNAMSARLSDLLFPTDDRNWGIGPTPVPELASELEDREKLLEDASDTFAAKTEEAVLAGESGDAEGAGQLAEQALAAKEILDEVSEASDELHEVSAKAKQQSDLMQEEIEDQFKSCGYQAENRRMIEDACKLGTGILKGPVLNAKARRRWRQTETKDETGNTTSAFQLLPVEGDTRPSAFRVNPWNYFPDPDVERVEDGEGDFERHLLNGRQFKRWVKDYGFDQEAARRILKGGAKNSDVPTYWAELNSLSGQESGQAKGIYVVWEYTGPVEHEDLELLATSYGDEGLLSELVDEDGEIDLLLEIEAKIWFCNNEVLSFSLHPLDSGESIYSVYNLERADGSVWGYGIPFLMRDPQAVTNGALRMMMDNAGVSAGPQVVVNKEAVTPEDGDWTFAPFKVWLRNSTAMDKVPFEVHQITSNQSDLAAIIELGRRDADESTAMPQIAQGEQGTGVTKTAQGMALLMNSANVVFRRAVKNFDDDVTVPMVRRFYDWNMQFSEKEEIKGDFEVDARGSSVLLVREMMAQNLMTIAQIFGDHPVYGPYQKPREVMKAIYRAHMIPVDELTKTEREVRKEQQEDRQNSDPAAEAQMLDAQLKQKELELKGAELESKERIAQLDAETRRYVADRTFDANMEKLAETLNMTREQLDAKMLEADANREHSERKLAVEVAEKQRTGISAGGAI